jgi:hypothetical protein
VSRLRFHVVPAVAPAAAGLASQSAEASSAKQLVANPCMDLHGPCFWFRLAILDDGAGRVVDEGLRPASCCVHQPQMQVKASVGWHGAVAE